MISTTNIPTTTSSISKVLEPGKQSVFIKSLTLDSVPYKEGAYHMSLNLESPPKGGDFEGFYIDKNNPDLGRHLGQVGRVRMGEYPFADGVTKSGVVINRDAEILKRMSHLCKELGCTAWLDSQDNKHDTIESLIGQFNTDKPYKDVELCMCIGGKEYLNSQNYTNFDLFLPKPGKNEYVLKNASEASLVMEFNPNLHIKKLTPKPSVDSFGGTDIPVSGNVASNMDIDI